MTWSSNLGHFWNSSVYSFLLLIFATNQCTSVNWNGNNWAMSCDFPGQDMSNVVIGSSQCGGKCAATSGCTHFSWTTYNGGTCWMKSGSVSPSNAVDTSDSNQVCGYMTSSGSGSGTVNWNGNNWAMSCDFPGQDMSNARVSSSQCGGTCAATSGCTHFTWTNYNGGTCWMKSGSASPSNAVATSDSSMVCGYVTPSSASGDTVGTTYTGVLATRHAATEIGACQLPEGDFASGIHPVALGDISSLGTLKFNPGLCGHILRVNCAGGSGPVDIVVNNANLGGGLDLYASSWDLATNHQPPGQSSCSVVATSRNLFSSAGPRCYYNPSSEMSNDFYHQLGLFNVGGKIVRSATLGNIQGTWNSITGYFAFNGGPVAQNTAVTFTYTDGSSTSMALSSCLKINTMHIWS